MGETYGRSSAMRRLGFWEIITVTDSGKFIFEELEVNITFGGAWFTREKGTSVEVTSASVVDL